MSVLLDAETKNQWARDDPAFVVICSFLLAVAATAFCAAYVPFLDSSMQMLIDARTLWFLNDFLMHGLVINCQFVATLKESQSRSVHVSNLRWRRLVGEFLV